MQNLLLGQKQESHADILHNFEFALVPKLGLVERGRVVLEIDVSVCERDDAFVAVVLGEVGTNFGPHVG